ncbi:MAG TPA: Ig-like domain-containing protein [Bacteroidota bacterium]|nr:Ig-like domain-containing protein [Bacteroidota bacterium]
MNRLYQYVALLPVLLMFGCKSEVDFGNPPRPDYDPLLDANIQPIVLETFPAANTQGPFAGFVASVRLKFNKVMDLPSLRKSVHISSELGDVKANIDSIVTADGVTFFIEAIRPDSPARFWWKVGEVYTLTIDSTVQDVSKNTLHSTVRVGFLPEPVFRILSVSPANGDAKVSPNGVSGFLQFTFNSEIDGSIFPKVHISPECTGHWHLEDPTKLLYRLSSDLAFHTNYSIAIDGDATDAFGHQLQGSFVTSFTTEKFRVIGTTPTNGESGIPPTSAIGVTFDTPYDTNSIRQAFTCQPFVPGRFVFRERQFYYVPNELFAGTAFKVTLGSSIRSSAGDTLAAPVVIRFLTDGFGVMNSFPLHGSTSVPRTTHLAVECNGRIQQSTVPASMIIYPAIAGRLDSCYDGTCSAYKFFFIPSEPLAANTTYFVYIGIPFAGVNLRPLYSQTGAAAFFRYWFTTGSE